MTRRTGVLFATMMGLGFAVLFGTGPGTSPVGYAVASPILRDQVLDQAGGRSSSPSFAIIDVIGQPSPVGRSLWLDGRVDWGFMLAAGGLCSVCPPNADGTHYADIPLQFWLRNRGFLPQAFRWEVRDALGWTLYPATIGTTAILEPEHSDTVLVMIHIPAHPESCAVDQVKFFASAVSDPALVDSCNMRVSCAYPTGIVLRRFELVALSGEVRASWAFGAGSEEGANLYRALASRKPWLKLNEELLLAGGDGYSFRDTTVERETRYEYRIGRVDERGQESMFEEKSILTSPALRFGLGYPHPNPTSGEVSIEYSLARPGSCSVAVYDLTGRVVRRMLEGSVTAGTHVLKLDKFAPDGIQLPEGVYFLRLRTEGAEAVRRLVIIR